MRRLGQYLLANPLHAMAAALFCAILPLISLPGGFLAGIIVGFVTLCRGYKTGFLILIGVAIPALIMALWKQVFFIDLLLLRCLLVWLLAGIFRSTVSWRLVLEIMTVLGILTVLGFYLFVDNVSDWWMQVFSHYQSLFNTLLAGVGEDKVKEMIAQVIPIATGLFMGLLLLGTFCQLLMARWWQAALFRPGGLIKEFVEIRSGLILAGLLTLTVIGALFGMAFAIDLLPVVLLPLAIAGLSLGHKWVRRNKKVLYLLMAVYIGLIFLPVVFIAILALAGYVDTWYDFRKRI